MKSKLAELIFNSGLMVVVLTLLSAPLLLGQLLATYESGALGESTIGGAQVAGNEGQSAVGFAVYPNVSDFAEYAEFDDEPMVGNHMYQTTVTFTAFSGQQAAYNGLFTIYNTSNQELKLRVEGGQLSGNMDTSNIWLNLAADDQISSTLVTEAAEKQATELQLAQLPNNLTGHLVLGDDIVNIADVKGSRVSLQDPLTRDITVGEKAYFNPVYYRKAATPLMSSTQTIVLKPQQKAVISLSVATEAGEPSTTQAVMPITISAE